MGIRRKIPMHLHWERAHDNGRKSARKTLKHQQSKWKDDDLTPSSSRTVTTFSKITVMWLSGNNIIMVSEMHTSELGIGDEVIRHAQTVFLLNNAKPRCNLIRNKFTCISVRFHFVISVIKASLSWELI